MNRLCQAVHEETETWNCGIPVPTLDSASQENHVTVRRVFPAGPAYPRPGSPERFGEVPFRAGQLPVFSGDTLEPRASI